jgi:hypothetical protein
MCKNLMIAGLSPDKKEAVYKFLGMMATRMTCSDRDGLGYAALTEGGLYGERWFKPEDAFKWRPKLSVKDKEVKGMHQGLKDFEGRFSYFIENEEGLDEKHKGKPPMAVIMHARMGTVGAKCIMNVHPFVYNGTALIHNGNISNHDQKHLKKINSTCDSETILHSYLAHNVANDPSKIGKVAKDLSGWYACGVLTKDKKGNPIMDIFRNGAQLWALYVHELDATVYCTVNGMVLSACEALGWKVGTVKKFKDDSFVRINARTGEFLEGVHFSPGGWAGGNFRNPAAWAGSRAAHGSPASGAAKPDSELSSDDGAFCGFGAPGLTGPSNTSANPMALGAESSPDNDETESDGDAQALVELQRAGVKADQKKSQSSPESSATRPSSEGVSPRVSPKDMELKRAKDLTKTEPSNLPTNSSVSLTTGGITEKGTPKGLEDPDNVERILH